MSLPPVPERDDGVAGRHSAAVPEELLHHVLIILGPWCSPIVCKNTLACYLGAGQRDIHPNHGVEDRCVTSLPQVGADVGGERRPRIDLRQEDVRGASVSGTSCR